MTSSTQQRLVISTAPFVRDSATTPRIMLEVLAAALLVLIAASVNFGLSSILVVAASTLGAVGTEWIFTRGRKPAPVKDLSATLTGVLLGLTLPPAIPLWMAFLGGAAGIGLGKLIWGGLGQNVFNPALVGRAFLQAAFPVPITTWSTSIYAHGAKVSFFDVPSSLFAAPLMKAAPLPDAISAATPLGSLKFQGHATDLIDVLVGNVAGSVGETSAILLILIAVWLAWRRIFDWRLPLSTVLTVAVFSGVLWLISPETYPPPGFMVLSGGLLFGAVFMVTDPVTTPTTYKGAWIYGAGVGVLVVLIRLFGGLPEGVMYAILLMNAATPHIDRYTQPKPFGG